MIAGRIVPRIRDVITSPNVQHLNGGPSVQFSQDRHAHAAGRCGLPSYFPDQTVPAGTDTKVTYTNCATSKVDVRMANDAHLFKLTGEVRLL